MPSGRPGGFSRAWNGRRRHAAAVLLLPSVLGACSGGPTGPGARPSPTGLPSRPAELTAEPAPGIGAGGALLAWQPSSGADTYLVEVGRTSGGNDFATIPVPVAQTSYTLGGLTVGTAFFVRVRARNQAGASDPSNEVRVQALDLRDVIDALYFGSGPLVPRDGARACVSGSPRWTTYPAGVAVRVVISTGIETAAQEAVARAADDWAATTLGTNGVIVELTGDPDPHPRDNEITVAVHPDPVSQGCPFPRGCTFLTIRGDLLVRARAIIGASNATAPSSFSHDAVGHGGLGMCHIDGEALGGARHTLMGGGPNAFSCRLPGESCIADTLTSLDAAAARAAYASGLSRGASRAEFMAAGLVKPGAAAQAVDEPGRRRVRLDAQTELVILDHR